MRSDSERNSQGSFVPKVSVIIATYNYSSVLRYAIGTVLWQTFQDFELIVVGDCCTDDSEKVVQSFGDARIRWLNLAENTGSKSLPQNAGIRIARGKFIAYLAHDDLWHPSHLENVVRALENGGADLAYSVAVYVAPPGETQRHVSGVFPEGHIRSGHVLVHSSVIHRKELIAEVTEWPDYRTERMPGDQLFWTRLLEAGKHFVAVPKLTVWKFNASSRPDCYRHQRCDEQARYFELLRDDPTLPERELIDVLRSAMAHGLAPLEANKVSRDTPPGSYIRHLRKIRGLEPAELMERLELPSGDEPFRVQASEELPLKINAGQEFCLELRLQNESACNLSSEGAHPIHLSYHWLNSDGTVAVFDGLRTLLIPPLPANSTLHYLVSFTAPSVPGPYQLQPALVQEGVRWFDRAWQGKLPQIQVRAR